MCSDLAAVLTIRFELALYLPLVGGPLKPEVVCHGCNVLPRHEMDHPGIYFSRRVRKTRFLIIIHRNLACKTFERVVSSNSPLLVLCFGLGTSTQASGLALILGSATPFVRLNLCSYNKTQVLLLLGTADNATYFINHTVMRFKSHEKYTIESTTGQLTPPKMKQRKDRESMPVQVHSNQKRRDSGENHAENSRTDNALPHVHRAT